VVGRNDATVQHDLARVLDLIKKAQPGEIVFSKNELSELLPRPTPLSLSLMQALWASGGSIDAAASRLGLAYQVAEDSNYVLTILGRLYINEREKGPVRFRLGHSPHAASCATLSASSAISVKNSCRSSSSTFASPK
jgi:hypothetical protein